MTQDGNIGIKTNSLQVKRSEVHEPLNRLRGYYRCQNGNRHIYELGSQVYSGLIFNLVKHQQHILKVIIQPNQRNMKQAYNNRYNNSRNTT